MDLNSDQPFFPSRFNSLIIFWLPFSAHDKLRLLIDCQKKCAFHTNKTVFSWNKSTINSAIKYINIDGLICQGHLLLCVCVINAAQIHTWFQLEEVYIVSMVSFFIRSSWCFMYNAQFTKYTHTNTHSKWVIEQFLCWAYGGSEVNNAILTEHMTDTWSKQYLYPISSQCIWKCIEILCLPLRVVVLKWTKINHHAFKTSLNCSARNHNKFGCVSVKMHTIRIEQILTLSKTQMHNIMRRTIDYNKPTNTIEMAEHFEKKRKTISSEWNFNRQFISNWMENLLLICLNWQN